MNHLFPFLTILCLVLFGEGLASMNVLLMLGALVALTVLLPMWFLIFIAQVTMEFSRTAGSGDLLGQGRRKRSS
ncbi:MAG: hypothetical protein RBS28_12465 [Rhodocyclaceae bacterium]|jgi:hypothetical protein|nr:hypothetical protein [Rhodocyclaceae bacterium]